jgi:DNA-binding transcriptional LysR family regulator
LDIQLLETFTDLMETRSFNRTAERLSLTQSTVSHRIGTLEKLLGARLFNRSRSGTLPTIAGERFLPHARKLIAQWQDAQRHVSTVQEHDQHISLGLHHDIAYGLIGETVQLLNTAFPGAACHLTSDYCIRISEEVASGKLDSGLVLTPHSRPELHIVPVGELVYTMVSTTASRLDQVTEEHYILPDIAPEFAQLHQHLLPHLSHAPLSCRPSADVATLLQSCSASSYLPLKLMQPRPDQQSFQILPDAPTLCQPVYAAVHRRNRLAQPHMQLLAVLRQVFS